MGRKKRGVSAEIPQGEPLVVNEGNIAEIIKNVVATKKEPYTLYAWFAYIDKEGFKVKSEHKSEGDTVAELLTNLEFPKGVNRLVNVTVTHNENVHDRSLAPHVARAILEHKDVLDFEKYFRGV